MGKTSSGLRHALLMGAAAFGIGVSTTAVVQPAYAQTATRSYNIPAQSLDDALREFGRQTGRDVLFTPDSVANKHSVGLHGQMTESTALQTLLSGSGLRFEQTTSGGYAVQDPNSPTRLGDASGAAPSEGSGATDEILVVGSHTLNGDIRRTENDAQPYVVFNSEDIERSGALDIEDFLQHRLPMNTQSSSAVQLDTAATFALANNGRINLRGLGANQTLILVDGRRVPSVSDGNTLEQPNINGIPPSAIERIEILPSTASGIYGGSATGGVINIILKRNYSGLTFDGALGDTFQGDSASRQFDLSGGWSTDDGRTRAFLTASHTEQDGLDSADRDFTRRGRERFFETNNIVDWYPIGNTPNITTFGGGNLVLDNGTHLNSPITFVPNGYAGPASDGGAGLVNNAGRFNLDAPANSAPLLQQSARDSFDITIRHRFSDSLEAYVDYYEDRSKTESPVGGEQEIFLPAASPYNPFQQDIYVELPAPQLAESARTTFESERVQLGIIAQLPDNWSSALEVSRSSSSGVNYLPFIDRYSGAGAALNYLGSIALRDPNTYPIADVRYQMLWGSNTFGPADTTLTDTALRLSGPLATLPGGNVTLSGLLEYRSEDADAVFQARQASPSAAETFIWRPAASQRVWSGYAEARAPIFSQSNARPLFRELELMAAIRHDEYSTRSAPGASSVSSRDGPFPSVTYSTNDVASTDYTLGLRYSPLGGVTFRASYGTGFLPPGLNQIASRSLTTPASNYNVFTDPLRGNTSVGTPSRNVINIANGNPNLAPEDSESSSVGVIVAPDFIHGLRLSVDYTDIRKTNEINAPGFQFIINNEASFPGRIVRGPNLPGDLPGWAGPIVQIDNTFINLAKTDVRAIDYELDYSIDTTFGNLDFYLTATQQRELQRQILPLSMPYDTVGYSDGPLEWRANFGLSWERGGWLAAWNAQYFDAYSVTLADPAPASASQNPGLIALQGSSEIPSQIYHDLFVRYRFGEGSGRWAHLLDGTEISFSVQNLLDERPPMVTNIGLGVNAGGGYSTYGDPRLRRFLFTVRHTF